MPTIALDLEAFVASVVPEMEAQGVGALDLLALVLEAVGAETIAYLKSLTDEIRPPIGARRTLRTGRRAPGFIGPLEAVEASTLGQRSRIGRLRKDGTRGPRTGPRRTGRLAHPGHWADRTSNLVNAYAYEVQRPANGVTLVLSNAMEYAAALEAHDGFFVLSGIAEAGGPVDVAIRRAVALVAPGWTVVR